ncbi:efflux RND transporter periplasmic adaptor subunit [Methyloceanibacter methanicus]|uniref:efflux RND transporter periplasmic adaptor subunit n=1 Tax=Methyloceanibacter methanicus TaxID=1774968 RepID=UPI000B081E62|nr:efflux RND transporter periplasmic adaptor subunit [Methyloceanibacter methanicus]
MNEVVPSEKITPDETRAELEAVLGAGKSASRFRLLKPLLLVGLAAGAAALAYMFFGGGGSADGTRYVTESVTRGDLTVTVTATGTVQPTNDVEISSELSGIVRNVLVDYNSPVTTGQTLAELDTDKLQSAVDSSRAKLQAAQAKVSEAEASVLEARLDHERKARLAERHAGSILDLEVAEAKLKRALATEESAKADVAAASADLAQAETDLEKALIRSPITGVVLSRNVEPGQTVASSLQAPILFTIAEDLTKMEVQVDVDEADVGKVHEGQNAHFSVDAYPGKKFDAQIRELRYGSEVVQGVVTYKAVLTTDNTELLLRPGMTATAEIIVAEVDNALTVPNAPCAFLRPAANRSTNVVFCRS